ncbi:hypothetical protein L1987_86372 [Smallanthus sonchifolius]|uniref:Uncharacterized protein n=2 Tax=Smallanthus sonchifolius TaxID=185202 RepID=A0ACB8Y0P5_9ASTR|nr:hypothetical protein L1987_86369 [Smallanthus sonchifolius]KAI3676759.1 hypothetical protein L1987_86372 [Smallanthus sonchifolius]
MVIKIPSSYVASDMCSSQSLSLTGLVCTQDQPSKAQPNYRHRKTTRVSENDINFEFSYSAQSTDLFELKLDQQSQVHGHVTMKDVLEPRYKGGKPRSGKETGKKTKDRNDGSFGHKLVQSIMTPCKSCSVVEPSAGVYRTNNVQGV